MITTTAYHWQT